MSGSRSLARTYKVVLLGDQNVGKTSIMKRWGKDISSNDVKNITTTVGVDPITKEIVVDGTPLKMTVWDPAGLERNRKAIVKAIYRDVEAVVFVYDVTDELTLEHIAEWIDECNENDVDISEVPCAVFANKCDLPDIAVPREDGEKFANDRNMMFCQSSALLDSELENLKGIFIQLGRMLKFSKRQLNYKDDVINLKAEMPKPKAKSSSCC